MNLDVGSVVGDYEIIGILGAGGMGKVFKVRNTISDRVEAMKVLLPDLAGAPELADRFLREIKVTASLDHPNIASLRTALRFGNQLLMVMELVDGETLEDRLKRGKLSAGDAADYIGQTLDALAYAHRLGVIHRDIKPPNMMLTPNGVIKLMDFGIAKGAADRKLTMTGTTMGSLYYMSPEQIQGAASLDKRTDLYALGVSLYELVTGTRPFDGDSQFAIMAAHLQTIPVPPVTLDPLVPAALNDVILRSVEKNPDERYQTAEDFRGALRAAVTPAPATARMNTAPVAAAGTMFAPPVPQATMAAPLVEAAAAVEEPAAPKSRRLLWVAAGAFCAVAAVAAIIQFGPAKKAEAGVGQMQTLIPPATAPATSPAATPVESAPLVDSHSAAPVPNNTQRTAQPNTRNPADRTPAQSQQASSPQVATPQQQVQQQVQQPPQVQQQAPPPQQPAGPSPAEIAKRAELKKVGDSLMLVQVRADAIHQKLNNFQASQASTGAGGLRSDWVRARSLMDQFLKQSDSAISAGDPAAAQDALGKAERQAEILEKALNM